MAHPLVSVVLATYNGERFLKQQLDSVINQTYPNLEIIVVDDGSSDNTINILNEYAIRYRNVSVFKNEKNLGFVKNFDKACGLASGEFIALCDQDDYWLPDKIKRCVEAIGDNAMVYCNSMLCNEFKSNKR